MEPIKEYKEKGIKVSVFDKISKKSGEPYKSFALQKSSKGLDGEWKNETLWLFESEAKLASDLLSRALVDKHEALNSYDAPDDFGDQTIPF